MDYLGFDIGESGDGIATLEAVASTTTAAQHAAALAEAQQVLDWAWQAFPHGHGPLDEGGEWDHDLQVSVEAGGWHVVAITLTGSPAFVEAFLARFGT